MTGARHSLVPGYEWSPHPGRADGPSVGDELPAPESAVGTSTASTPGYGSFGPGPPVPKSVASCVETRAPDGMRKPVPRDATRCSHHPLQEVRHEGTGLQGSWPCLL